MELFVGSARTASVDERPHRTDSVGRDALVPASDIIAELPQLADAIDVHARAAPRAEATQARTADTDDRIVLVPQAPVRINEVLPAPTVARERGQ